MAIPKLIEKWFDRPNNITNYIYLSDNGVKIVISQNPATLEFNLAVLIKGGSYPERRVGVPQGTSHFLEHMLLNPNTKFKDREEMDKFLFGNKTRPTLFKNASTSVRFVSYYVYANEAGADRMIEFLHSVISYPEARLTEHIEKERKIIVAEWQRKPKIEKDSGLQWAIFLLDGKYLEFSEHVLGDEETISKITVADLVKFRNEVYTADNTVLAVQTSAKPDKKLLASLDNIASEFKSTHKVIVNDPEELINTYRYKAFNEPKAQGLSILVNYFTPWRNYFDYPERISSYLTNSLVHKVGLEVFRERKGLVYGIDAFSRFITWTWTVRGYRAVINQEKLPEMLDEMMTFWDQCLEYLNSKAGKFWFQGEISKYIFKGTPQFDGDYAENTAADVLMGKYKYDAAAEVKAAKQYTLGQLEKYIVDNYRDTPPQVWFESSQPEADVEAIMSKSKFNEIWQGKQPVKIN